MANAVVADLRVPAKLMRASQAGEAETIRLWWRGWFGGDLPEAAAGDHATMPGMPPAGTVRSLRA